MHAVLLASGRQALIIRVPKSWNPAHAVLFELRIPRAAYAPVRLTRGNRSHLDLPPALLEGEVRIARKLPKDPENAALLTVTIPAGLTKAN